MLSEETTTSLLAALRDLHSEPAASHDKVKVSVSRAATEARQLGLSAEQFLIWLKEMWAELASEGMLEQSADPMRTRDGIISTAIKAYYVQ